MGLVRGLFVLLVLAALAGAVVAGLSLDASAPAPTEARATLPPSARLQVEGVSDALAEAKQRRQPIPVSLSFTDKELTAAASAYFPQTYGVIRFSDPVITLRASQVVLSGRAAAGPLPTTFTIAATPSAAEGRPVVRIDAATVGGVPVPDAARQAIAADLQKAIASLLPANLQITSVTVGTGSLAVKGVANP